MKIEFRRLAAEELRRDAAYYSVRRKGWGRELRKAVQKVLDGITDYPERWPAYKGDTRRAIVSGFPFAIYYQVRTETILVFRVVHTSRDPGPIEDLLPE